MYTPGPAGGFSLTKGTHGRKMYTHAEFAWLATFYLPHTATVSSACLLANFCVVMCVVRVRTNGDSEYLRVCCPASLNKVNSLTFRQNGSSTFIYALCGHHGSPGPGGGREPPGTHSVCRTRAKGRPSEARPRAAPGPAGVRVRPAPRASTPGPGSGGVPSRLYYNEITSREGGAQKNKRKILG